MYGYLAGKHLLHFFGSRRLCDLSRLDVEDFINLKQRESYAPKTLRHLRNLLSKVFAVALSRELIAKNPARNWTCRRWKNAARILFPNVPILDRKCDDGQPLKYVLPEG
jgi:hypothetical protein